MKYKKKREKRGVFTWIVFVILMIYALTLLYPFYYLLIGSLKGTWEFMENPLGLPEAATLKNYITALTNLEELTGSTAVTLPNMLFHSITLSAGTTFLGIFAQACTAYVLAKYEFRGNKFIYMTVIICNLIPTVGSLPATFKLASNLKLFNNYIGMLLMQGGGFGGFFLYMHAYFKALPWSFAESAMIDGAGHFQIFTRIMLPLSSKALTTYTVLRFLGQWNEYWVPSIFYERYPTLSVGLMQIQTAATNTGNYPLLFAAMIVTIIPVLILFAAFQKQMMGNLLGGGVKE